MTFGTVTLTSPHKKTSTSSTQLVCVGGYDDGCVRVFDTGQRKGSSKEVKGHESGSRGQVLYKLMPHKAAVKVVALTSDGKCSLYNDLNFDVFCFFSCQGEVLLSGCEAGLVMVTNVMTGVVLRRVSDHSGAPITGIDIKKELVQVWRTAY